MLFNLYYVLFCLMFNGGFKIQLHYCTIALGFFVNTRGLTNRLFPKLKDGKGQEVKILSK